MIDRRLFTNFDWALFGVMLAIAAIGVVNIYSASASYKLTGSPYYLKQLYWIGAGLGLVVLVCSIDYHILEDLAYGAYGTLLLLLMVVLAVGRTSMGATRWLHLGVINVQPSEPMKIALILALARFLHGQSVEDVSKPLRLMIPLMMIGLPALLSTKSVPLSGLNSTLSGSSTP